MRIMVKGAIKYRWIGVLTAVFLGMMYLLGGRGLEAMSPEQAEPQPAEEGRADIIAIDSLKAFGNLTKPEVIFLHDAHTEALEKVGKDCSACHMAKSTEVKGTFSEAVEGIDPLSPKFKRLEDTARREVMDVYHTFCTGCHLDMQEQEQESGPITCGGCHRESRPESNWREIGMDKSLHARHTKSESAVVSKIAESKALAGENASGDKQNCQACHHAYDEEKETLFYDKGKEGTCRYCHKDEKEENRVSFREAAHLDCLSCHRAIKAKNEMGGPVKCAGCHSPAGQAKIEKLLPEEIPRMKRNQPDATLVSTGAKKPLLKDQLPDVRMSAVAFNHKEHELANDTCRVCHHASMDKCSSCHTLSGDEKGDYVTLEQAHHLVQSEQSCIGCHRAETSDPNCAGCHYFMSPTRKRDEATCLQCHETLSEDMKEDVAAAEEPEAIEKLAKKMLKDREYVTETYPEKVVPEKVVIKILEDQYEAAELPHRKIVNKLMANIKDNKMAAYYHADKGTLCQGCHHNSPASVKPPKCATCHAKPFDENNPNRPGLLAAYHQQCMTCHEQMNLEKPKGCTGCHKKKQ
jgi:hypothetical protein